MHKSKTNYVTTYWYTNYIHIKRHYTCILSNERRKNNCNWTVRVQVIVKDVVTCLFQTQCSGSN